MNVEYTNLLNSNAISPESLLNTSIISHEQLISKILEDCRVSTLEKVKEIMNRSLNSKSQPVYWTLIEDNQRTYYLEINQYGIISRCDLHREQT